MIIKDQVVAFQIAGKNGYLLFLHVANSIISCIFTVKFLSLLAWIFCYIDYIAMLSISNPAPMSIASLDYV